MNMFRSSSSSRSAAASIPSDVSTLLNEGDGKKDAEQKKVSPNVKENDGDGVLVVQSGELSYANVPAVNHHETPSVLRDLNLAEQPTSMSALTIPEETMVGDLSMHASALTPSLLDEAAAQNLSSEEEQDDEDYKNKTNEEIIDEMLALTPSQMYPPLTQHPFRPFVAPLPKKMLQDKKDPEHALDTFVSIGSSLAASSEGEPPRQDESEEANDQDTANKISKRQENKKTSSWLAKLCENRSDVLFYALFFGMVFYVIHTMLVLMGPILSFFFRIHDSFATVFDWSNEEQDELLAVEELASDTTTTPTFLSLDSLLSFSIGGDTASLVSVEDNVPMIFLTDNMIALGQVFVAILFIMVSLSGWVLFKSTKPDAEVVPCERKKHIRDYSTWSVSELRKEIRSRNTSTSPKLPSSGIKADFVRHLMDDDAGRDSSLVYLEDSADNKPLDLVAYNRLSRVELKKLLLDRKCPVTGEKGDLIRRLVKHQEAVYLEKSRDQLRRKVTRRGGEQSHFKEGLIRVLIEMGPDQ